MINIKNREDCCGCGSCAARCPKQCIQLLPDSEGFLYPQVDSSVCIDCGLCEKVCPVIHLNNSNNQFLEVYAAINAHDQVRKDSSSGGIFTLLAEYILNNAGVVFGARFDKNWQVIMDYTEKIDELPFFRGSKYVQAATVDTFRTCEVFLKQGRKVLYTGTPCQIAGLHRFLRKGYDNLFTLDFICHGTPSPKVWKLYLDEVTQATRRALLDSNFSQRGNGWKHYGFKFSPILGSNNLKIISSRTSNHYMRAFLADLTLRPSCYECPAKSGKSQSDFTIADFWGISKVLPEWDDDKGTSLLMIHSTKGIDILESLPIQCVEVDAQNALRYNPSYTISSCSHHMREEFFQNLNNGKPVTMLIDEALYPTFKQRIIEMYWRIRISLSKALFHRDSLQGESLLESQIKLINQPADFVPIAINFRDKATGWQNYSLSIILGMKKGEHN